MTVGLGELCALLAPLAWSFAVILFKRSSEAPAASINLFKNAFSFTLITLTMVALGAWPPTDRPLGDWARLIGSGILGLAIADTLLFEGMKRIGAARVAVADTVYAPTVVVLSWLLLGENPSVAFAVGAALVIGGIAIATFERGAFDVANREVLVGMAYATVAIATSAFGVVLAKPVLEVSELVEVSWFRLLVGLVVQSGWITARGGWADAVVAFRPAPLWRSLVPAAFVGSYLSLLLWLGGYKWADASVAAVLNQLATVYTIVLARLVLDERLRTAQVVGAGLAASGALWIVLAG